MKRQRRYVIRVDLGLRNAADVIGLLSRKPLYIDHNGAHTSLTFTFKYLWEVLFWFQKLTRRGYWVSLSNR
jgi:hypothetical protein